MQLIIEEVTRRVAAVEDSGDVRDMAEQHLHSLLVLDPEARAVFDVWLAFLTRARVDASLWSLRDETHARVRDLCRRSVETLRNEGKDAPRARRSLRDRATARTRRRARDAPHTRSRGDHAGAADRDPLAAPGRSRLTPRPGESNAAGRRVAGPQRVGSFSPAPCPCRRSRSGWSAGSGSRAWPWAPSLPARARPRCRGRGACRSRR
jgi:BetI-type transcriptional repressor, C-terminal